MDMFIAASRRSLRRSKARRTLDRALNRYARREAAYNGADTDLGTGSIWWSRETSAMAYVKQARDLAGRLEAMVYDEVGL